MKEYCNNLVRNGGGSEQWPNSVYNLQTCQDVVIGKHRVGVKESDKHDVKGFGMSN